MKHESLEEYNMRMSSNMRQDVDLIEFKMSDVFYDSLKSYVDYLKDSYRFIRDIGNISSNELNNIFVFELKEESVLDRLKIIEERLNITDAIKYTNINLDFLSIYRDYFSSSFFKDVYKYPYRKKELDANLNKEILNYEDYMGIIFIKDLFK